MIIVTGGSGKLGHVVVHHLMDHGYDVTSIDMVPPPDRHNPPLPTDVRYSRADITNFGDAMAALSMIDGRVAKVTGLVHLAAVPAPGQATNHVTFATNMLSTYNMFEAARQLGIRNVVWASSETVYGLPYANGPVYVPIDEEVGHPESAYSLSKLLSEKMAEQFCRWDAEAKIVGLRFSNVMEPQDYARFPEFDADPRSRHWNLWTYIDARDGAQAVRLALEAKLTGAHVFGIANAELGDEPLQRRPARRGLPRYAAQAPDHCRGVADFHRQGARGSRLRAAISVARAGREGQGAEGEGVGATARLFVCRNRVAVATMARTTDSRRLSYVRPNPSRWRMTSNDHSNKNWPPRIERIGDHSRETEDGNANQTVKIASVAPFDKYRDCDDRKNDLYDRQDPVRHFLGLPYPGTMPPWAFDHSAGPWRNFSTSSSVASSKVFSARAILSTSHQVAR